MSVMTALMEYSSMQLVDVVHQATQLHFALTTHDRSVRNNSLFIDSSTIDQKTVRDIATKTTEAGGNYLDSPVSGGEATYNTVAPRSFQGRRLP